MRHDTAQVFVSGDRDAGGIERALHEAAHALAGAKRVALARNQDGSWGAGDYTLDVLRDDSAANGTANCAANCAHRTLSNRPTSRTAESSRASPLKHWIELMDFSACLFQASHRAVFF